MAMLSDVLVGIRKGNDGRLLMSLEFQSHDNSRALISKSQLDQLYVQHNGLKPRVDGFYQALALLNQVFATHNYEGWSINSIGLVECLYPEDNKAVDAFNAKLNDLNGFINRSQQRKRAATQPALEQGHAGWVYKEGGLVKNWKKRYMVLQNLTLYYYDTDNITPTTKPKGTFEAIFVENAPGIKNGISVFGPVARVFKFRTDDQSSCTAWLEAISRQLSTKPNLRQRSQSNSALPVTRPPSVSVPTFKHANSLPPEQKAAPLPRSTKPPVVQPVVQPVRPKNVSISAQAAVHTNVKCDGCSMHPIVGSRYMSKQVPGNDFCHNCVSKGTFNASYGPFDILTRPLVLRTHNGVQCDGCLANPLRGKRYVSKKVANFDLCQKCVQTRKYEKTHGPFARVLPAKNQSENGGIDVEIVIVIEDYDNEDGIYEDDNDVFAGDIGEQTGNDNGEYQGDSGEYDPSNADTFNDESGEYDPSNADTFNDESGEYDPSNADTFNDESGEYDPSNADNYNDESGQNDNGNYQQSYDNQSNSDCSSGDCDFDVGALAIGVVVNSGGRGSLFKGVGGAVSKFGLKSMFKSFN